MTEEMPDGCLGCNKEPVAKMLLDRGIDLSQFTEVPRPRHNWGDITACDECGRAWLIDRKKKEEGKLSVENAIVKTQYGILVAGENTRTLLDPVRMSCGFVVVPPESGWPRKDIACPCGDETHFLIGWQK